MARLDSNYEFYLADDNDTETMLYRDIGNYTGYSGVDKLLATGLCEWKMHESRIAPETFVRPKLRKDGKIMRQSIAPGMLIDVQVKGKQYIAVVLGVQDSTLFTRPLAGCLDLLNGIYHNSYTAFGSDQVARRRSHLLQIIKKTGCKILDPMALPTEWYSAARAFQKNIRRPNLQQLKQNLYARLAEPYRARVAGFRNANATFRSYILRDKLGAKLIDQDLHNFKFITDEMLAPVTFNRGKAIDIWNAKNPDNKLEAVCNDRHVVKLGNFVIAENRYRGQICVCKHCAANRNRYVEVLNERGETILIEANARLYRWEDDTIRVSAEPSIIGEYHDSRDLVGQLPRLDGGTHNGINLGFELEVECVGDYLHKKENVAKKLKTAIQAVRPATWDKAPRYAFFERDRSVDTGFEMVTSYGALDVHRHHVMGVFSADSAGKLPFFGQLRSHDATVSCGLHVHMTKPTTLSHAVKLQAFFNDPANKRLIKCVARRYENRYSKADANKNLGSTKGNTVQAFNQTSNRNPIEQRVKDSIFNLSRERYDIVNYKPTHTVEIRVFKGTMMPNTIMACLELSHAAWFFSRDNLAENLTTEKFLDYISMQENRAATPCLRAYLAMKGFKVFRNVNPRMPEMLDESNSEEA